MRIDFLCCVCPMKNLEIVLDSFSRGGGGNALKVIQIHHVSWILLFILWYVEVILRAPSHLHKYINELMV